MSDYDRWKTTPPEPDVVETCTYCGGELYDRCDYVHDRNEDEWFCDDNCFIEHKREIGDLATEVISNDA
jgi:hypothetical protein